MSGKSSAVAGVASEIGVSDGTHAGDRGDRDENLLQPDLLRAFDEEVAGFDGHAIAPPARRGPGRPAGSPNRSTLQLRKLLLANGYRDPAEFLASIVSGDTTKLAEKLSCDKLEAAKLQRQAATDLLPYFHQRLPAEEDRKPTEARPLVMIMTGDVKVATRRDDGTLSVLDIEPNQGVSETAADPSHDASSHEDGNT